MFLLIKVVILSVLMLGYPAQAVNNLDKPVITQPVVDGDGDGIADKHDNCPQVANPKQEDTDGNQIGNACDNDIDGDEIPN
ncbi:MAG: thrombospondin type 3 repeat-containing protein [Pseudomonadota bacterium]|nr:thrombospondin type 3 repeat-containing protein [Pseudomonadota bacterium]